MSKPPVRVVHAEYVRDYQIKLRFNDAAEKIVDFSSWLRGEVFKPLTNSASSSGSSAQVEQFAGRTGPTSHLKHCEPRATLRRTRPNGSHMRSPPIQRSDPGTHRNLHRRVSRHCLVG